LQEDRQVITKREQDPQTGDLHDNWACRNVDTGGLKGRTPAKKEYVQN